MRFIKCLLILFFAQCDMLNAQITRGDSSQRAIALVFTGDEFNDGGTFIASTLKKHQVKASFFLTGNFYRNTAFTSTVQQLKNDGHYLGSHSDKHLLYCDWVNRDSLLVSRDSFFTDLDNAYRELKRWDISKEDARYFLPPYEWYNDTIVEWTRQAGLELVNFTPGTRSTADYTYPEMGSRYVPSEAILQSILNLEQHSPSGLNGFILLVHIGTDPRRKDKFYTLLPALISGFKEKGYQFVRIDRLLE